MVFLPTLWKFDAAGLQGGHRHWRKLRYREVHSTGLCTPRWESRRFAISGPFYESWLGDRPFRLRLPWFSSVPPDICWHCVLKYVLTTSFPVHNSSFRSEGGKIRNIGINIFAFKWIDSFLFLLWTAHGISSEPLWSWGPVWCADPEMFSYTEPRHKMKALKHVCLQFHYRNQTIVQLQRKLHPLKNCIFLKLNCTF